MNLTLNCAPNFRDLAATAGQGRLRTGLIYRSDVVLRPSDEEAEALRALGVRLVFDLRSALEAEAAPNVFWRGHGIEVLEFNIGSDVRAKGSFWEVLKDDHSPEAVHALLSRIYRSIPMATAPALSSLFKRLAQGDAPLVIHCSAGKDRTGFVSAMLLSALGADREEIRADYLASQGRSNPKRLAHARALLAEAVGGDVDEKAMELFTGVHADFLDASFSWIDRKFGDTDGFLREVVGLDEATRGRVRELCMPA